MMICLTALVLFWLSLIRISNANTWGDPRVHPAIQGNLTDTRPPIFDHLSKRSGCAKGFFICQSENYMGCCPNGSLCQRLTAQCLVGTCGSTGHVCSYSGCCYAGQYCGVDEWCYPINSTATGLPSTYVPNPSYEASVATSRPTWMNRASQRNVKFGHMIPVLLLISVLV
ncbi:hypothetical protein BGW37DRAFT_474845, partial [Umbelopsis sp. PMI_123]